MTLYFCGCFGLFYVQNKCNFYLFIYNCVIYSKDFIYMDLCVSLKCAS